MAWPPGALTSILQKGGGEMETTAALATAGIGSYFVPQLNVDLVFDKDQRLDRCAAEVCWRLDEVWVPVELTRESPNRKTEVNIQSQQNNETLRMMYERFTDRAKQVIERAHQESDRLHHQYVETEHILLGLVTGEPGVAVYILSELGVKTADILVAVKNSVRLLPDPKAPKPLLYGLGAKKVLEYAIIEGMKKNYVGTEHLLLGLLQERDGVAAQILMSFGLTAETVREQISKLT